MFPPEYKLLLKTKTCEIPIVTFVYLSLRVLPQSLQGLLQLSFLLHQVRAQVLSAAQTLPVRLHFLRQLPHLHRDPYLSLTRSYLSAESVCSSHLLTGAQLQAFGFR